MWYTVENSNDIRPNEIDSTSSAAYVYVRKGIVRVESEDGAFYRWQEMKIPKEMWDVCSQVMGHESALDDVYAALTELAEIIVGE